MSGKSPQLDNRLMLCARFVRRGAKLADIGTDQKRLRLISIPSRLKEAVRP